MNTRAILALMLPGLSARLRKETDIMAEYGEWNRKGATLSDATAKKEYGVDRDFIVKGLVSPTTRGPL